MKKYMNIIFIILLCITFFITMFGGEKMKLRSAEEMDIHVGAGIGIDKNGEENIAYRVSATTNAYKEDETTESVLSVGVGDTIGKTREDRQKKAGKRFFLGLLKVYIIDEEYARYGIIDFIDINFKNSVLNTNTFIVVCKDKNEKYFNFTTPGYDNAAEYISDMIKSSVNYNFFREGYMFKDAVLSIDAEGRNMVSPYIEITDAGIKITGIVVFKKDKLAAILDMEDTRTMNMMRDSNVNGILTIQGDSKKYVNYKAEAKRKITCKKIDDKYVFVIDLDLKGEIINNELYENMSEKVEVIQKFEEDMAKQVKETCTTFLAKMKNEYKVDALQLGWVAAAKYGRDTGVDWDKVVCSSDIKVNVRVHVTKVGRGQY